jgi:RecB family exonuclease
MRDLWLSASAYETWLQCPRKWVFDRVWKLPRKPSKAVVFGTILHAVLARWLKADETGRDAKGNPVDIYPEYWHRCEDGEVDSLEQSEIKTMVDRAIEQGILVRKPGLLIEEPIKRPLIPGVLLIGTIDVLDVMGKTIQDHKTSKNGKYTLTPASLVKSNQMLIYAGELAMRFFEAIGVPPQEVYLRHNQFIREGERVRAVDAVITVSELDAYWNELEQNAEKMLGQYQIARQMLDSKGYDHSVFTCGGPEACNAYGGCPFLGICSGQVKFPKEERKTEVNFFDKLKLKKDGQAASAPAPQECIACGGSGRNTLGGPCKACIKNRPPAPEPAPVVETASAPEPVAAVTPEVTTEVAGEVTTEVEIVQTSPFPNPQPKIVLDPKPEEPKKKRGRPRKIAKPAEEIGPPPEVKGEFPPQPEVPPLREHDYLPKEARINPSMETFPDPKSLTLYIRAMPVGRAVNCVERLFKVAMDMIMVGLEEDAPETFWHLDAFRRRDMLTIAAGRVEILTDIFVAAPDSTPEMKAFVQGLRQRFENIVEGI